MELQELKYKKCPVCGSIVISEYRNHQHCNGHWNEEVAFKCGCIIKFSPNFMSEQVSCQCPQHPDKIIENNKRKIATKKLVRYIGKLDIDTGLRDRWLREITIYSF